MAQPVKTVVMTDELKSAALSRFDQLQQEIRKRAFERYCMRNGRGADPLDDWLAAEREIVNPSLLVSSDCEDQVQITAATPGFEAKQLAVMFSRTPSSSKAKQPEHALGALKRSQTHGERSSTAFHYSAPLTKARSKLILTAIS